MELSISKCERPVPLATYLLLRAVTSLVNHNTPSWYRVQRKTTPNLFLHQLEHRLLQRQDMFDLRFTLVKRRWREAMQIPFQQTTQTNRSWVNQSIRTHHHRRWQQSTSVSVHLLPLAHLDSVRSRVKPRGYLATLRTTRSSVRL